MKSLWDDRAVVPNAASGFEGELEQLAYAARLLSKQESLGLYAGGSVSVKMSRRNLLGEQEEILYIGGGRQDLGSISASDLVPVRCKPLAGLVGLETLADAELANELSCHRTRASTPVPPVDAVAHAVLPYRHVCMARPDAVLAIACTPSGMERLRQIYGESVLVVAYARQGLPLAQVCAKAIRTEAGRNLTGILVMNQCLVTWAETAQLAYERTIDLVTRAEQYLERHGAWSMAVPSATALDKPLGHELAALRKTVSDAAGLALILSVHDDPLSLSFSRRDDLLALAQRGPAVAGHAVFTGRWPMIGRNVEVYGAACEQALNLRCGGQPESGNLSPRIVLDPDLGACALGRTAQEARWAGQIWEHTLEIILRATTLEEYQSLPPQVVLDAELGLVSRTQAQDSAALFAGEIALVTGGASGIGKACVESLLARGAAVVSLDINPAVRTLFDRPDYLGLECDLTNEAAIVLSFEKLCRTFGGLDMLVLNAGTFPAGCRIEALALAEWQRVMRVNLDSNVVVLREAYPLLSRSPLGGRVVVNASKNVLAPGVGAAAYSSSKAAITQLARVAALEWGKDRIRVNMVHPDAVFDTGIWTEDVLKARAAHYGLTVQQYKTRNLLGVELNSRYVGELVAEMLGPLFEKITGTQIPVDGGSDRVI